METTIKEEFEKMKNELKEVRIELQQSKKTEIVRAEVVEQSEQLFDKLLNKVGDIAGNFIEIGAEIKKYEIDKEFEIENKRIDSLNKIASDERKFKFLILFIIFIVIVVLALFGKITDTISIISAVVVGAILKDNIGSIITSLTKKSSSEKN